MDGDGGLGGGGGGRGLEKKDTRRSKRTFTIIENEPNRARPSFTRESQSRRQP